MILGLFLLEIMSGLQQRFLCLKEAQFLIMRLLGTEVLLQENLKMKMLLFLVMQQKKISEIFPGSIEMTC